MRAGDTLQSIAQAVWGDSALWYRLAQANALYGEAGLAAGQVLTIPPGVQRSTLSASTLRPYDPGDVLGDLSPVNPPPRPRPRPRPPPPPSATSAARSAPSCWS